MGVKAKKVFILLGSALNNMERPRINYPCEWEYRIIGTDEAAIRQAVSEIIADKKYTLNFSNISKAGKYISLALKIIVENEEIRNSIYTALRQNPAIKSLL